MGAELRRRLDIVSDRLRWALKGVPLDTRAPEIPDRLSPRRLLDFSVGGKRAQITFGAPDRRDRVVFGELIPYGDLWRMGADEPTLLRLPFSARVAGAPLSRGVYSLYAIPQERGPWRLVINGSIRQSGRTRQETGRRGTVFPSDYTDAVRAAEVARVEVEARHENGAEVESLIFEAVEEGPVTTVSMRWDRVTVSIPIESN